ncbi:MAG: hypothetical protein NTY50_00845 [Methylobacter sp.]|nr:hypothetical protein [Methylobacter sp.]
MNSTANAPKFSLGKVVATPGAILALEQHHVTATHLLDRHCQGDWGTVPEEDAQANQQAIEKGARILSSYALVNGAKIWIITEADRSATTLLLPEEY